MNNSHSHNEARNSETLQSQPHTSAQQQQSGIHIQVDGTTQQDSNSNNSNINNSNYISNSNENHQPTSSTSIIRVDYDQTRDDNDTHVPVNVVRQQSIPSSTGNDTTRRSSPQQQDEPTRRAQQQQQQQQESNQQFSVVAREIIERALDIDYELDDDDDERYLDIERINNEFLTIDNYERDHDGNTLSLQAHERDTNQHRDREHDQQVNEEVDDDDDGDDDDDDVDDDDLDDDDLDNDDMDHEDNNQEEHEAFFEDQQASRIDVSASQVAAGMDIQGIPWQTFPFTRDDYRKTRLREYKNYENLDKDDNEDEPENDTSGSAKRNRETKKLRRDGHFYDFCFNTRRVKSSIVHFQLRNLVWATSDHDVYLMHQNAILHWDALQKKSTQILNLSGDQSPGPDSESLGRVQVSTMIVRDDIVVAGGFYGEVVAKSLLTNKIVHNGRITYDENAITNAVDVYRTQWGSLRVMSSNNDCHIRTFDAETFTPIQRIKFDWPVNHATRQPHAEKLMCVVGDDTSVLLVDADSGKKIHSLEGHRDYSFATAWHPDGKIFATGNQDSTCRIWDARYTKSSLCILQGHIGAIRALRFTDDGQFLSMSEPADFVHIIDTANGNFSRCQEIDLFGEIAGISFSPGAADALFVGVFDRAYGSLLEYERKTWRRSGHLYSVY